MDGFTALQGFTSSALLHYTVALPIPNAERKIAFSISFAYKI